MSVNARDTIQGALKLIGVHDPGESLDPQQTEDGLDALNDLIDLWALDELFLYGSHDVTASFAGATATVGTGQTFNTARPISINYAYIIANGSKQDVPVVTQQFFDGLQTGISNTGFPEALTYRNASPIGTIEVYPAPTGSTQYHLNVNTQITEFANLDTVYELPQGHRLALKYALAEHLAPVYQRTLPDGVERVKRSVLNAFRRANVVIPKMESDFPLMGRQVARSQQFFG